MPRPTLVDEHVLAQRPPFAREMTLRRIGAGKSQADLARETGVPQTSVSAYEVGVLRPGPRSRAKIEAVLGDLPAYEPDWQPPLTERQLEQAKRQLGIE